MDVTALVEAIKERLVIGPRPVRIVETVATILERTAENHTAGGAMSPAGRASRT